MPEPKTLIHASVYVQTNDRHKNHRNLCWRILFLMSLIAGSFTGVFTYSKLGSALTLLIPAVGKELVTVSNLFFFSNQEIVENEESFVATSRSMSLYS